MVINLFMQYFLIITYTIFVSETPTVAEENIEVSSDSPIASSV